MLLTRISLFLSTVIYGVIGVICLLWPVEMAGGLDMVLTAPTAVMDFRATYGGMLLGFTAFFAICAIYQEYFRIGLIAQALSFGGLAFGRGIGLIFDGTPKNLMIYFIVAEIVAVLVAIYCLVRLNKA
jgi:hypothetical protein